VSTNTQDLQTLRLLLAQQQPQINVQPVQDVGSGIAVGVNNIVHALQQRQQQKQLAQLILAQQSQAQEMYQQKMDAYQSIGLTPEQAHLAVMDDQMGRQLQEQAYKSQQDETKQAFDQSIWKSNYDAAMALTNGDIAKSQLLANSAMYGQRLPIGSSEIGKAIGQDIDLGNINRLAPQIAAAQTQQPSTTNQAVFNALGIKFDPLYSRLQQATDIAKGNADAQIRQYEAQATPNKLTADINSVLLSNQGKGIQNQLSQNTLNRDDALLRQQLAAMRGEISVPTFGLMSGILSDNPAQTLNGLIGKDHLYDKVGSMTIPDMSQPTTPPNLQTLSSTLGNNDSSFAPIGIQSFNPNLNLNPEARGHLFRREVIHGLGELGKAIGGGISDIDQFHVNTGNTIKGFFGLPLNPTDPFGQQQRNINDANRLLGRKNMF
jgi:hypothetical protein